MLEQLKRGTFLYGFENEDQDVLGKFNKLFVTHFEEFHDYWITHDKKTDIMHFNIAMQEYFKEHPD